MTACASFDALSLAHYLEPSVGTVARGELHLFGYLACVLFLVRENPAAEWQYEFSATEYGAPFSPQLDDAIVAYEREGLFERQGTMLGLTDRGRAERGLLRRLSNFSEREEYLEPACASALAMPVGLVRRAISKDPQVAAARHLGSNRPLLDETALETLYAYFAALRAAVQEYEHDLLAPAVVWLSYLSTVSEADEKT